MRRLLRDGWPASRDWKSFAVMLLAALACGAWSAAAQAQRRDTASPAPATGAKIAAESAPYRIEWDGSTGFFGRDAFAQEPEQKTPLVYLHTDPGPKGHSKYLAWFLARSDDGFAILWCYLNDTGSDFWCWLYRFPTNQLTTLLFRGDYRFKPPAEATASQPPDVFALKVAPRYLGPDFVFFNWTRRAGTLSKLNLWPARALQSPAASASPAGGRETAAPARTLTQLSALPLHEVRVGPENGWREGGWRELHALAFDAASDPYYLILYSNTTRGFAIDLRRAVNYETDFGQRVRFADEKPTFTGSGAENGETVQQRVRRFERHEIALTTERAYANPYTEVMLVADFKTPDGQNIVVPGFWDGGKTWKLRFAPMQVGDWTWRVRSEDPELNGQQGAFECVAEDADARGFLKVQSAYSYRRHFATRNGEPFLPAFLREPAHRFSEPSESPQTSFDAFRRRVIAAAAQGFNRFVGGYLLSAGPSVNEGGALFTDNDPDRINPAYFQWMDRRIAACNEAGIVPDIGLGWVDATFFQRTPTAKLRRLWRYALARYAAYDACWNLFGADNAQDLATANGYFTALAEFTRQFDPYRHPITTLTVGSLVVPAPEKAKAPADPNAPRSSRKSAEPKEEDAARPPSFAEQPHLDVITQWSGDVQTLSQHWEFNKPLVLMERLAVDANGRPQPMTPEIARRRMWETRMRGGYWAGTASASAATTATPTGGGGSLEAKWAADCARFFRATQFWRLEPHPDLLGEPEDAATKRRRRREQKNQASQAANSGVTPAALPPRQENPNEKAAPPGVHVLANPAWEYVVYFEQGGTATLDLLEATGRIKSSWFNPRTGEFLAEEVIRGGAYRAFTAPDANDWVLYLSRR